MKLFADRQKPSIFDYAFRNILRLLETGKSRTNRDPAPVRFPSWKKQESDCL